MINAFGVAFQGGIDLTNICSMFFHHFTPLLQWSEASHDELEPYRAVEAAHQRSLQGAVLEVIFYKTV